MKQADREIDLIDDIIKLKRLVLNEADKLIILKPIKDVKLSDYEYKSIAIIRDEIDKIIKKWED